MGLKPRKAASEATLVRACRYARLNGVRRAAVCERFDITIGQLREAMRTRPVTLGPKDLVLAALTHSGRDAAGQLSDLASIAGYVDWQNHDGCQATDVERMLGELVAEGLLEISGDRWRLVGEWP